MDCKTSIASDVARVKRILARADLTSASIARRLGVSQPHVSNAINGRERPRRLQQAVAALVGLAPKELWGGLYRAESRWYEQPSIAHLTPHQEESQS